MPNTTHARLRAALVVGLAVAFLLPAVVPSHASAARLDRFEKRLLKVMNQARRHHGLRAVRHRPRLSAIAARHSGELLRTGRLSHVALDGRSATQRLARVARGPVGEVIAWSSGRTTARSIVRRWLNSPPHRAVLLSGSFRRVGIGARRGRRGLFVTADFARR